MSGTRPGPSEGWSTYMADWRARTPRAVEDNRLRERARSRAKTRLARMYPDVFARILDEEVERASMEFALGEATEGREPLGPIASPR